MAVVVGQMRGPAISRTTTATIAHVAQRGMPGLSLSFLTLDLLLELLFDFLFKKFAGFLRAVGLRFGDDLIDYFGAHLPRDLVLWMQLLELLDRASLRTQRKITLPLLKSVLADNPELSRQGSLY